MTNEPTNQTILAALFTEQFGVAPHSISPLPRSGSDRYYYRMQSNERTVLGAFNPHVPENEAFFSFTQTFCQLGLNVPSILAIHHNRLHYLLADLGNQTMHARIETVKATSDSPKILCMARKALDELIKFQVNASHQIDYSKCYPRDSFDKQSVLWDLNYFKYNFLKLVNIPFDEQLLENDFQLIADQIVEIKQTGFMIRDFQPGNIIFKDEKAWFIDYQGGRRGPYQYDVASLLYSPKTQINEIQRDELLNYYIGNLSNAIKINTNQFRSQYYAVVLVRIMQALGAYGYRGLFQHKANFRESIPVAIQNLKSLLINNHVDAQYKAIPQIIENLATSTWAQPYEIEPDKLTVFVRSFSYKNGMPEDPSTNGGGFVFDCRGLPNPGREQAYRHLSGLDQDVVTYLEKHNDVFSFREAVQNLVAISVSEYQKRNFNHLCVSFGCTGGQHRSVYQAEQLFAWLKNNFDVKVVLLHIEQKNWRKDA